MIGSCGILRLAFLCHGQLMFINVDKKDNSCDEDCVRMQCRNRKPSSLKSCDNVNCLIRLVLGLSGGCCLDYAITKGITCIARNC